MRALIRRAAAAAILPALLSGCAGGGGSAPVATPGSPAVSDAATRSVAQSALLAEWGVAVFMPVSGGPMTLARRRTSALAPLATTPCTNGYDQQTTASGFVTHAVVSLYYEASCTTLRQRMTVDFRFGVDTADAAGTIVAYDPAGHVTGTQTATDFYGASLGFARRHSSDAAGSGSTSFGQSSAVCIFATLQCTLAAVIDGAAFETGVLVTATVPTVQPAAGSSVTLAFSGSVRLGTPGTITLVEAQPIVPALTGGGTPTSFTGTLSATFGVTGPSAFTLGMDVGTAHVAAKLANGTTTFAISGGTTATVNANGDGTIRYANGATESIVDYRISG